MNVETVFKRNCENKNFLNGLEKSKEHLLGKRKQLSHVVLNAVYCLADVFVSYDVEEGGLADHIKGLRFER